jgi:hypothetical protein
LAVTQNAAATRLFHNATAKPGMRVRLRGPAGNPTCVGAVLRVRSNGQMGPPREIHSGSGYWSQDSATEVIQVTTFPAELSVRWPNGQTSSFPLTSEAREVTYTQP